MRVFSGLVIFTICASSEQDTMFDKKSPMKSSTYHSPADPSIYIKKAPPIPYLEPRSASVSILMDKGWGLGGSMFLRVYICYP